MSIKFIINYKTMAEANEKIQSGLNTEIEAAREEKEEKLVALRKLALSEKVEEQAIADIVKAFNDKTEKIFQKYEREKAFQNLRGNKDEILNVLKGDQNYVKIEENTEVMGYKGKKVHINLPKVGKFEGYKFDYFVSDDCVTKKDFEEKPELEKKSYSMNDVSNLLKAMNRFMAELGCETDGDMKYENDLKYWKIRISKCDAGDCLKAITGLNSWYLLSDKNVALKKFSRAEWCCYGGFCCFDGDGGGNDGANLFLRLSD